MANTTSANTTAVPSFTEQVNQEVFTEPLGGPVTTLNALDRFPEAVYNKSVNTHFIKFMYSLLGPAGVGWIKKNYLEAKLEIYEQGFNTFSMERYYGNPFAFSRILSEELEEFPEGLLTREQWEIIKTKDESYRSRAITFLNAVRAGGTPEGIELAAQSGLNYPAFVVENYKYLFDSHSDFPLELPYFGTTYATEEFIVIPRQETSQSSIQLIAFAGYPAISGLMNFTFNGQTTKPLPYSANNFEVESALKELGQIGSEGITVSGGPNPNPFTITFTGPLSNQKVATLTANSSLVDNLETHIPIAIKSLVGGVSPAEETVVISDEIQHNAQTAIDRIRPLNTLPTNSIGMGTTDRVEYSSVHASSAYMEAIKYVTGSNSIKWPEADSLNWIEEGKEKAARSLESSLSSQYLSYHTVAGITAYTNEALSDPEYNKLTSILSRYKSEHIGRYSPESIKDLPFLANQLDNSFVYAAKEALPPCSIPAEVTVVENKTGTPMIGGEVAIQAISENGSGEISIKNQKWWSSLERAAPASDLLEIDLGETRVVNWIAFEITRKPTLINLDYDALDESSNPNFIEFGQTVVGKNSGAREFKPVVLWSGAPSISAFYKGELYDGAIVYSSALPPWQEVKFFFRNANQNNIATRYLRLSFERPEPNSENANEPFQNPTTRLPIPYSIDVRQISIGRYTGVNYPSNAQSI